MDRDNCKAESDNGMELQIRTGSVKTRAPVRKMLAEKSLNWPPARRTTEILAAESVSEGFCRQAMRTVQTELPAESAVACGLA